jgi:hypothetical protein
MSSGLSLNFRLDTSKDDAQTLGHRLADENPKWISAGPAEIS